LYVQVHAYADKISQLLMPKTRAYYEIWMDEEKIAERSEEDPLYQDRYLPRKFKIGIAIPPHNDVDVLTNDIGLIAIIENNALTGFNIAIGGGLSQTQGNAETYPRLATVIGFAEGEEQTLRTIYEILTVQRDFGNRSDRKLARLKYTVDNMGVEAFKAEVEKRTGMPLQPAKSFHFEDRKDMFGWRKAPDGKWYYTVFVENGRVTDDENCATKTALYEIAKTGKAQFHFTSNQNVILAEIEESDKTMIDALLEKFGVKHFTEQSSALRRNSMACVAFNTCPLALAEAQRYLPSLISKIEPLLQKHQLQEEEIILRMTGCPNGCGRSPAAEIGFIGTAYGLYNLHIGGDRLGTRLNVKYKENLDEAAILEELDTLFGAYQNERQPGETFGDFTYRRYQYNS
jgi:sulfite reductase (NADPH) hemoprotein beta-component